MHDAGEKDAAGEGAQQLELLQIVRALLPHRLRNDGGDLDTKVQEGSQLGSL